MAIRLGDPVEKSYGRADINDRYHRYDKILGRGAYKTVYWGWDTADGVDVAWNAIDLDALPSTEERSKISREVDMLQQLNHRHILRIRDNWENPLTNQLCFITDILQGGSLREYIRQRKVNLHRCKSWCIQILDALNYLHCSTPVIIHRDLKCDNIFIDGPSGNITIGDLGLSTQYASSNIRNHEKGMSIVGTPEFMAPELYEEQYDEKVDIYAFGMCVLEMVSKKYPYEECTNQIQVIRKVTDKKQPDILRKLHRYVRTFIEICIERDALKRPTAMELLGHPFLTYMDDLKNKLPVSDFVFDEDRIVQTYKEMELLEMEANKLTQMQLSTIQEKDSCSPSPLIKNHNNRGKGGKKKKKKYVSGTSVCIEEGGNISVKLKLHHDKESQKVQFQYNPNTENISSVVREMVETLELDQTREYEIVNAIKTKLNTLTPTNMHHSSSLPPTQEITPTQLAPTASPPLVHTQTTSPHRYPTQRNVTVAPNNITLNNTVNNNNNNTQNNTFTPHTPHTHTHVHFGQVFNSDGSITNNNNNAMPVTSILNNKLATTTTNNLKRNNTIDPQSISAPVTPGHSPPTEKNMNKLRPVGGGYSSDPANEYSSRVDYTNMQQDNTSIDSQINQAQNQNQAPPKLVSDSLLDQIMALPRQTIKARIKQFGGSVNDEDETRILVTKLFQLLSENTNRRPTVTATAIQNNNKTSPTDTNDNDTCTQNTLIHHNVGNIGTIQHTGISGHNNLHLNVNNLGNLNSLKSSYHSDNASSVPSIHTSPPSQTQHTNNIIQTQPQRTNITNIVAISPTNELVYQQRQISQDSNKSISHHSHSIHSQSDLSPRSTHQRTQSMTNSNISIAIPQIIDDEEDDDEIDPNIQLPKLRIRQKELMKNKICAEMLRLKQRNDTQLGRDKTFDNIALELDEVEKQIKILTDAAKTGHVIHAKIKQNKKINKDYSYHSDKDIENKKNKKNNNPGTLTSRPPSMEPDMTVTHVVLSPNKDNITTKLKKPLNKLIIDNKSTCTDLSIRESMCNSNSVSLLVDTEENNTHISSPLVSKTKRDEFDHYVQQLPERLDLLREIGSIQQQMGSLKNVSYNTWHSSENRIVREKKQLEEEYNQYYADQTEMLLLKLQKHKHNAAKCISETQSTANKLKCKQDKQRNKFKSIVDDQLQILQLTQELNENEDNPVTVPQVQQSNINDDEYYLYKEEMDKLYLERVKQFEFKQKKEFDAFRSDLHQLKQLRLESRKKSMLTVNTIINHSSHSSPKRSPPSNKKSNTLPPKANNNVNGHNNIKQSSPTLQNMQMDILTGLGDELMENERERFGNLNRGLHYHSSSLPLMDHNHNSSNINIGSKFKVSAVGNYNVYPQLNIHTQHHSQSTANIAALNQNTFDLNNNKNSNDII